VSSYSNLVPKTMFESEHQSNNYHDTTSSADEPYHSSAKSKYIWPIHTRTSYGQHYSLSNQRYNRESNDFHRNSRQNFYSSQTNLPQSQKVIGTTHSISPLMSSKANNNYSQPQQNESTPVSPVIVCQLCSSLGHTARDCPF
jgi:hypothetical protein